MEMRPRIWRGFALAAALCIGSGGAIAQSGSAVSGSTSYPTKPVHLVVPYPPGGATDIIARNLAQKLQEIQGQPVVMEYKPGAGGVIATEHIAKSAPDGYTSGIVTTAFVINPSLRSDLPYDTLKDFSGVSIVAISHIMLAATPSLQANSVPELIALAKRMPGKLTYASAGTGGAMHLSGELLKSMTGIDMVHVPYKGGNAAYPDVIAGRVQLIFDPVFASMPLVKSGKLKALALASPKRPASHPELPTIGESVPGYGVLSITGIVVPHATPREVVHRLSADIGKALE